MKKSILEAYNKTKAYYCLDCGKCTSNCPVSSYQDGFSPRLLIKNATVGFDEDLITDSELWDCLTCNTCADRCSSDVQFAEFIRAVRAEAIKTGNLGVCSHNGVLQGLMRFMTTPTPELKPNRLNWLNDELKTEKRGKVLLFTGCMPIFQTVFENIGVNSVDILKASIKLMNYVGMRPVVTEQERCCGHDMLWTGEVQTFKQLAELNARTFTDLGIETIITVCPEGYMTLKNDYPEHLNNGSEHTWDFKVIHITEYLAELIRNGELTFPEDNPVKNTKVTYHDPCRLGRFMGVYDAPREILSAIPGVTFREMEHNRNRALCCGVSSWTNCTNTSRSIRAERLLEAQSTCSDKLLTACPKCQIHLKCYTANTFVEPQINIDIEDITAFTSRALGIDP